MKPLANVYATDEDVALRASSDYSLLCPKDQKLAWGADGVFTLSDRWTLNSATVNFTAQGLVPGQIVQLVKPVATFRPPGESLAISSVTRNAITLRRKGQAVGIGQPPGPIAGLSNVEFLVTTLSPQIEIASYDLNRRYGIDDLITGRRASDLYDPREVRDVTVLSVLYRQYLELARFSSSRDDPFATKANLLKVELDELLARVVVHWGSANYSNAATSAVTHFSTRISR